MVFSDIPLENDDRISQISVELIQSILDEYPDIQSLDFSENLLT